MKCSSRWSSTLGRLRAAGTFLPVVARCAKVGVPAVIALTVVSSLSAQTPRVPRARLIPASPLQLPGDIDSNNPAVWSLVDGVHRL